MSRRVLQKKQKTESGMPNTARARRGQDWMGSHTEGEGGRGKRRVEEFLPGSRAYYYHH